MKCKTCMGYGMWSFGREAPMGRMDASDGYPTIPCPECGADANPKMKTLKDIEVEEKYLSHLEIYETEVIFDKHKRVIPDDLRSVAREWIKLLEKDLLEMDVHYTPYKDTHGMAEIDGKIDWIRYFFNLEDE